MLKLLGTQPETGKSRLCSRLYESWLSIILESVIAGSVFRGRERSEDSLLAGSMQNKRCYISLGHNVLLTSLYSLNFPIIKGDEIFNLLTIIKICIFSTVSTFIQKNKNIDILCRDNSAFPNNKVYC